MRWFKLSHLSFFTLFISLVVLVKCDSYVSVLEGELTQLHFPYPCDSSKITLQVGNRLPFYRSDLEYITLNADQSERFSFLKEMNIAEGHCSLHLNITSAKRTDAGTYILFAYVNDYIFRVGLDVEFLPGAVHCSHQSHHGEGDWVRLHCRATVGSMAGQIQCYQGGMRMPSLTTPSETLKTLKQTIMVQESQQHVFCCSSPLIMLIEPKERCDCNDFVWDPLSEGEVNDKEGPCPTTTPLKDKTVYVFDQASPTNIPEATRKTAARITTVVKVNGGETDLPPIPKEVAFVFIVLFIILLISFMIRLLYLARAKIQNFAPYSHFLRRRTVQRRRTVDNSERAPLSPV